MTSEFNDLVRVTRKGRKAFKAGLDGTDPVEQLVLEISMRVKDVTLEHLIELSAMVLDQAGSVEAALTAVKSGTCTFEKIESTKAE